VGPKVVDVLLAWLSEVYMRRNQEHMGRPGRNDGNRVDPGGMGPYGGVEPIRSRWRGMQRETTSVPVAWNMMAGNNVEHAGADNNLQHAY
jgi:hypothetical protein